MVQIRATRDTDDFEVINRLVNDTFQRNANNPRASIHLVPGFRPSSFIAEEEGQIIAIMEVTPSEITHNGTLEYGYVDGCETVAKQLLDQCIEVVRERGGTYLYKWVTTRFGQVRNKEITFWERWGFISDEYAQVSVYRKLTDWRQPELFESTGIDSVQTMGIEDIEKLLVEDGEEAMAELLRNQYSPRHSYEPNQVILTLRDSASGDVAGIAYYRVVVTYRGTPDEFLDASAFGIHIRPQYEVSRGEIRRFVQGCLITMKQLDLRHVHTRLTLNNFDVFAAIVAEGFHNTNMEGANTIRLTLRV